MVWLPTVSAVVVRVAWAWPVVTGLSVTVPSTVLVVVSVKVTVPVGVIVPPPVSMTVAVKESGWPNGDGSGCPTGSEIVVELVRVGSATMTWSINDRDTLNVALPL